MKRFAFALGTDFMFHGEEKIKKMIEKSAFDMTILVIKLGALGDFIVADAAFSAICKRHGRDKKILLTTPAFADFAKKLGYFDEVVAFPRFSFFDLSAWRELLSWFRNLEVTHVYDLQLVNRTHYYFYAFKMVARRSFEWVGHVKCSPYCLEDHYFKKHPMERFARLLSKVNLELPPLDIRRLGEKITIEGLSQPYALMVPNASNAFHGAKKWPLAQYQKLAIWLTEKGYDVVVIGGKDDDHALLRANEKIFDLTGKTSLEQVIFLSQNAAFAVGNDTGPIHMAAASLCPVFVLFSKKAPPAEQVGARGPLYYHKTAEDLQNLTFEDIKAELELFILKTSKIE